MTRTLSFVLLMSLAVPFANQALSADCICPKMPMYPIDATNWFHYAMVCRTGTFGCIDQYPTGHIGPPQQGRSCGNSPHSCVNCSSLGTSEVGNFELYYGDPKGNPASYESLDSEEKIRAYLKANVPRGADPALYDDFTFSRPFAASYQKPIVVVLTRNAGSISEDFHAIVWQIRGKVPMARSYIGIEISGVLPGDVTAVKPCRVCNAVATESDGHGTVTHKPIPGLLQTQFTSSTEDIAFVRLHNSNNNRMAGYMPCKP